MIVTQLHILISQPMYMLLSNNLMRQCKEDKDKDVMTVGPMYIVHKRNSIILFVKIFKIRILQIIWVFSQQKNYYYYYYFSDRCSVSLTSILFIF